MTLDPHALKIYIDGSSLKNPGGACGYAGIAEHPTDSASRQSTQGRKQSPPALFLWPSRSGWCLIEADGFYHY